MTMLASLLYRAVSFMTVLIFSTSVYAADNAALVSHTIPGQMSPSQYGNVTVTMKNTGTTSWNWVNDYELVSTPDHLGFAGTAPLNSTTLAGASYTFSFAVVAPPAPGTYSMQMRMAKTGVPFGTAFTVTVTVGTVKVNQTIAFGALGDRVLSATPFAISASSSASLPVTFSSSTPGVCSVSGTSVTTSATGVCTIAANQNGNADYNAAPQVTQSFNVNRAAQTISFAALGDRVIGSAPFSVSATASSTLGVAFSSLTTGVCTVSGASVSMAAPGVCTVAANQSGNSAYDPAPQMTQSFTVTPLTTQTINFAPLSDFGLAGGAFELSASSSSGLPVTFASTTPGVCSANGTTVVLDTLGVCTIVASQGGNGSYSAAPPVSRSFNVVKTAQAISFAVLGDRVIGSPPFSVSATSSSTMAVTFSSLTTGVCTVSGSSVTMSAVGVCTIAANQAGSTAYAAAPQVTQSFSVTAPPLTSQTISFNPLGDRGFGGGTFELSASSTSGLPVTFASSTPSVCTIGGTTAYLESLGVCTIVASQGGNGSYSAAAPVSRSFNVVKSAQAISFAALGNRMLSATPFSVSATSSSTLSVSFSSLTTGICTVSGSSVTMVAGGLCTIAANQAGNMAYDPAPQVTQSFTVTPLTTQTINFAPLSDFGLAGGAFELSASSSSGLPVTFASTTPGVCSANGTTVVLDTLGVCTIVASQGGNGSYSAATPVSRSFNVVKTAQAISFAVLGDRVIGAPPFSVSATSSSNMAVTFSSLTTGVCTVSGSSVSMSAVGVCTIAANQAGSTAYAAAPQVTQSFSVTAPPLTSQTITFNPLGDRGFGGGTFELSASSTSGLPLTFASSTPGVCTIGGTTAYIESVGLCTIVASQGGNGSYSAAAPVSRSFNVVKTAQAISFAALGDRMLSSAPFSVSATSSATLTVSFSSLTTGICTVSGSSVTMVAAGVCTIAANQAGNMAYDAAPQVTQSFTVTMTAGTPPVSTLTASNNNVRVAGTTSALVTFTGNGSGATNPVTLLELFRDSGNGYDTIAVATTTGNSNSLNFSSTQSLGAGVYRFKLRSTDSALRATDSSVVVVNVTNSSLLGVASGVRVDAQNRPQLFGWTCEASVSQALAYSVYLDAPTPASGGVLLSSGVANLTTEADNASVQSQCNTPGAGHHFNVDLSSYTGAYSGRALFVTAQSTSGNSSVSLPCTDNNCTMPGSLRIGLTSPVSSNADQLLAPATVFMRAQLSGGTGPYDEIAFSFDGGAWVAGTADAAPGTYYANQANVSARGTPYTVQAKVRQGSTTLYSTANLIAVVPSPTVKIAQTSPADGASAPAGQLVAFTVNPSGMISSINSVKFYANGTLVGIAVLSNGAWTYHWLPTAVGTYVVMAKAFDAGDVVIAQSASVNISITAGVVSSSTPIPVVLDVPHLANPTAGSMPGTLAVVGGSTVYSIPISVPPGTAGFVPAVSLNYRSDDQGAAVGLGWSVGGLSSITRCGRTVAIDGITDAVRLRNEDRLCMDGQRLILVNGDNSSNDAYWAAGAEYRTEIDVFTRVVSTVVNGKQSFVAYLRNGNVWYYGETDDAVVADIREMTPEFGGTGLAHRWHLSRTIDPSTNYISYSYFKDTDANGKPTGESRPKEIRWGGNVRANQAHHAKLIFEYSPRIDVRNGYVAGSAVPETQILSKLLTQHSTLADGTGGGGAQIYYLTHEYSPTSGRSRMKSVKFCDSTYTCLPENKFDYGNPDASVARAFVPIGAERIGPNLSLLQSGRAHDKGVMSAIVNGDFNGDGMVDMLERERLSANGFQQRLYLSEPGGTSWTERKPLSAYPGAMDLYVITTGDFDGDGRMDLLVADGNGSGGYTNPRICKWSSGAFACETSVTLPADAFKNYGYGKNSIVARDINSDGRDDLLIDGSSYNTGGTAGPRYACLANGTSFGACALPGGSGYFPPAMDIGHNAGNDSADMDGDGRADQVILGRCQWMQLNPSFPSKWECPDSSFGSPVGIEVFGFSEAGTQPFVANWFPLSTSAPAGVIAPTSTGTLSADLNGDGYSDLVFGVATLAGGSNTPTSFAGHVCFSKGDSNADCKYLPTSTTAHLVMTVGDFDGDGYPDVLRSGTNTWSTDNPASYNLCRVYAGGTRETCSDWQGPLFYSKSPNSVWNGNDNQLDFSAARSMFNGDFDGDGRPDFITYLGGDRWQVYSAANLAAPGEALDKLVKVTDGLGKIDRVEYAAANDASVYSAMATDADGAAILPVYPNRGAPVSHQLVKKLIRGNGGNRTNVVTYKYAGNAVDGTGRGELGFARQEATDDNGISTITWSRQDHPFTGMVAAIQTRAASCLIGDVRNVYESKTTVSGKPVIFPFLKKSTVQRKDIDAQCTDMGTVVTTNWFDEPVQYGNQTRSDVVTTLVDSFTNSSVFTYFNNVSASRWQLGLPNLSSVTNSVPGYSGIRTTRRTYDADGLLESEIGQEGDLTLATKTTTTYGRAGNLFGLVNTKKVAWFDPATQTAVERLVSTVGYDAKGRYAENTTNSLNHREERTYDPRTGAQTSFKSANLLYTAMNADGFGRTVQIISPDQNEVHTLERQCDAACPPDATSVLVSDMRRGPVRTGVPVLTYRDSAGHVLQTVTWGFDGRKIVKDVRYDQQGREYEVDWPRFDGEPAIRAKQTHYDGLNRVRYIKTPDEIGGDLTVTTEINYKGPVTEFINAKNQRKIETRDGLGRLTSVVDAKQGKTRYVYDAFDNLTTTTDPLNNEIKVAYDALGRRTELNDPDLGRIEYFVDPLGQVWKQISPNQRPGKSTTFKFDALGRKIERNEDDLTSRWTYDSIAGQGSCQSTKSCGQLVEANTLTNGNKDYTRLHTFDAYGRTLTTSIDLATTRYTSTNVYDSWGRLVREQHVRGADTAKQYERRYNVFGYLSRIERSTAVLWAATAQDAANRVTAAVLGNGLRELRDFNQYTGRLAGGSLKNGLEARQLLEGYQYDALGNVMQRTQYWPNEDGFIEGFSYDELNRLKSSTIGSVTKNYTYNAIGNIDVKSDVSASPYVYPSSGAGSVRPHAVSSIPGLGAYLYDGNGNLTSGSGRTAEWTSFNMPKYIAKGGIRSDFVYGPEHQRTRQIKSNGATIYYAGAMEVEEAGAARTVRTYWPGGLGMEIDGVGAPTWTTCANEGGTCNFTGTRQVRYGANNSFATLTATGALGCNNSVFGDPVPNVVKTCQYSSTQTGTPVSSLNWTHQDRLGSMVAITDENGILRESLAYDAWGMRRQLNSNNTSTDIDGLTDNKGFTRHEMLDALDLVHMNGRVYDPVVARFMSGDPILQAPGDSQSYNRYSYVRNNPTNSSDPSGFTEVIDSVTVTGKRLKNPDIDEERRRMQEREYNEWMKKVEPYEKSKGYARPFRWSRPFQFSGLLYDNENYWTKKFVFVFQVYERSNPLEMELLRDYLSTVPDWLVYNEDSLAYIYAGFEDFAKQGALGYAISATGSFEQKNLFSRSFNPLTIKETAAVPSLFQEVLQLQTYGPSIITPATYEHIYGRPAHSWSSLAPGWQVPKGMKQ